MWKNTLERSRLDVFHHNCQWWESDSPAASAQTPSDSMEHHRALRTTQQWPCANQGFKCSILNTLHIYIQAKISIRALQGLIASTCLIFRSIELLLRSMRRIREVGGSKAMTMTSKFSAWEPCSDPSCLIPAEEVTYMETCHRYLMNVETIWLQADIPSSTAAGWLQQNAALPILFSPCRLSFYQTAKWQLKKFCLSFLPESNGRLRGPICTTGSIGVNKNILLLLHWDHLFPLGQL